MLPTKINKATHLRLRFIIGSFQYEVDRKARAYLRVNARSCSSSALISAVI